MPLELQGLISIVYKPSGYDGPPPITLIQTEALSVIHWEDGRWMETGLPSESPLDGMT